MDASFDLEALKRKKERSKQIAKMIRLAKSRPSSRSFADILSLPCRAVGRSKNLRVRGQAVIESLLMCIMVLYFSQNMGGGATALPRRHSITTWTRRGRYLDTR